MSLKCVEKENRHKKTMLIFWLRMLDKNNNCNMKPVHRRRANMTHCDGASTHINKNIINN